MANQIVAHLIDGRVIKGSSLDVNPSKPRCHVRTDTGLAIVTLAEVKSLFFVRNLEGNPDREDRQEVDPADLRSRGAKQVMLKFTDGERMVGLMNSYPPLGNFFFLVPADPRSNNARILVNRDALVAMELVTAESDAQVGQ